MEESKKVEIMEGFAGRSIAEQMTEFNLWNQSEAFRAVTQERLRQIEKGYTAEHDAGYTGDEIPSAAIAMLMKAVGQPVGQWSWWWPWSDTPINPNRDYQELLVRAAALILAELEREMGS